MHRSRCRRRRGRRPTAARASRSAAVPFSPRERRLGRASDPFFLPAVLWPRCGLPTPSLPHADDPQVYIPSKPALLYCPSSLRVDPFLLLSAVPKPPRHLLRHVLCTYVLYDRYSYTFFLEREMGTRILSRYHSVFVCMI